MCSLPSGTSSSITDGEFSSSLLSCSNQGTSLSMPETQSSSLHQPSSSTISGLSTLTRKSTTHRQTSAMKNVSFQPASIIDSNSNLFDDLFLSNSACDHQQTTSTFSTLPKLTRRDSLSTQHGQRTPVLSDLSRHRQHEFPTLETVLQSSLHDHQHGLPQPPPLLNGIRLLDRMLTKTNDERTQTLSSSSSTSHSGWYNVTSNSQTRASIV
jgi:hypothetical protein